MSRSTNGIETQMNENEKNKHNFVTVFRVMQMCEEPPQFTLSLGI